MSRPSFKIEIDGLKGSFTKSYRDAAPDIQKRLRSMVRLGLLLAKHIQTRAKKGHFATSPGSWADGPSGKDRKDSNRPFFVLPSYARAANAPEMAASSRAWHAAAGAKIGNVTGGMWKGLGVVSSPRGVTIRFGGKSEARSLVNARKMRKGEKVMVRSEVIENRTKAGAVMDSLRVNIIQPSDQELQAVIAVVMLAAAGEAHRILGFRVPAHVAATVQRGSDPRLLSALKRSWLISLKGG
jgi:hypothetical protein